MPSQMEAQSRRIIENYSYNPRNKIGEGYTSTVFEGKNDINGNKVAVKVIDLRKLKENKQKELLKTEIQIMKQLHHPNIVAYQNAFLSSNNCYLITQFCNQGDLASTLSKVGRLRQYEALPLMRQICQGYNELSEHEFIHRDLKPANILLHDGIAKIGDFGFAKKTKEKLQQKYRIGSPMYMSPQAMLRSEYSLKNDIWALGMIFYEILQGRLPWENHGAIGRMGSSFIFRIAVAPEMEALIRGCLDPCEDQRLGLEDIITALQGLHLSYNRELQQTRVSVGPKKLHIEESYKNICVGLKTKIHLCRFVYKITTMLEDLTMGPPQKQNLQSYLCSLLQYFLCELKQMISDGGQCGIARLPHFRRTEAYKNFEAAIREYQIKYTKYLDTRVYTKIRSKKGILPNEQILTIISTSEVQKQPISSHNITLDFIISLLALISLYLQGKLEHININQYLEYTPQNFNAEGWHQLSIKKSNAIKMIVQLNN